MPEYRKTLYIFGAGSSRNYNNATHSIPGLEPPMNSDFFKMLRLVILNDVLQEKTRIVSTFLRKLGEAYSLKADNALDFLGRDVFSNLEAVMTHLYIKREIFESRIPPKPNEPAMEDTLKELIVYCIQKSLQGPLSESHRKLIRG
jgi:hypothetical protein